MGRQRISLTSVAQAAMRVLGQQITLARHERKWTIAELAARSGVSAGTVSSIEHGDPSPSIGNVFNVAVAAGVPLFGADRDELYRLCREAAARIALLPFRVDPPRPKDDPREFDF